MNAQVSVGAAVDRLAAAVGELPESEFACVWTALGVVVRAVCRKTPTPTASQGVAEPVRWS